MNYRAEIDGLRAIAVLSVILYHAQVKFLGIDWFEGGFIGVDIFFVISGYLITRIILNEIYEKNSFNFFRFYVRRTRRILPALLLVIAACFPFAWKIFLPADLVDFAGSALSAIGFGSNFYFYYSAAEYGADPAFLKPLLHTWSLGVEEQFYIVTPVIIFLIWKFAPHLLLTLIIGMFLLSIQFAHVLDERNSAFNFFLSFSRFWELFVGSILAYGELKYGRVKGKFIFQIFPFLGIFITIASVLLFDENTPHPNFQTLIPVFGVVLIIVFCSKNDFVGRSLSSKPFVGIGLISYSLYLWHFPIFAFGRTNSSDVSNFDKLEWILLSFGLSFLSFKFVETPFRTKKFSNEQFSFYCLTIVGCISLSSVYIIYSNGADFTIREYDEAVIPSTREDASIALVGDSHARHLLPGLNFWTNGDVKPYISPGCIPFRNVDRHDFRYEPGKCAEYINQSLDEIVNSKFVKSVILTSMGPVYLDNTAFQQQHEIRIRRQFVLDLEDPTIRDRYLIYKNGFKRTVEELLENDKEVYFIIDIPELGRQFRRCLIRDAIQKYRPFGPYKVRADVLNSDECQYERYLYDQRTSNYRNMLKKLENDYPSVRFIDPVSFFCDNQVCRGFSGNHFLYTDADHLTLVGSILVVRYFLDSLGDF